MSEIKIVYGIYRHFWLNLGKDIDSYVNARIQ